MSFELINTVGTVITTIVVAATAVAALVQLRHMRAGNQIRAMLNIGAKIQDDAFVNAGEVVNAKLAAALEDPAFRNYVIALRRASSITDVDPNLVLVRRAAVNLGNTYEELGILVKNGIVDDELFLDRYCGVITGAWKHLEKFTAFMRELSGDQGLWEHFELVTVMSEDWLRAHPTSYPEGYRRLPLHNPWPISPVQATS
jgi:hypothetical protein